MTRGCRPSDIYRSACFSSSPTMRTTEVVPSPVISSCAVAARAIMTYIHQWWPSCRRTGYGPPLGFEFATGQSARVPPLVAQHIHTISRSNTFPSFVSLIFGHCQPHSAWLELCSTHRSGPVDKPICCKYCSFWSHR